jgi:hypothetical protein
MNLKCTPAIQGGLLVGHKSTPVKHTHILFPPACSYPLITEALAGPVHENIYVCHRPGQAKWHVGSNVYVWYVFGSLAVHDTFDKSFNDHGVELRINRRG